ncbi:hypothetical protein Hanom_Chr01g00034431 [Helianthus anomalus]
MLFLTIMIDCQKNGNCELSYLPFFPKGRDISTVDWCSMIYSAIRNCKVDWVRDDAKSVFNGPLTILLLLYLDSTTCNGIQFQRMNFAMAEWNMERMKLREKIEIEGGGFGRGNIRELFVNVARVIKEDNNKASEDKSNSDTLKDYLDKLDGLITLLYSDKDEFECTIIKALRKFPDDEDLKILSKKYHSLFGNDGNILTGNVNIPQCDSLVESSPAKSLKGKELMTVEDENDLSQFWKDPSNMEILFGSVDRLSKSGATSDAPSFSLGVTQEFDMDEPTTPVCKRNEYVYNEADDHVPLTVIISRIKENQVLRSESKWRDNQIRLPYLNMPIDFNENETKEEERCSRPAMEVLVDEETLKAYSRVVWRPKGLPKRLFSSTSIVTKNSTSEQNLNALFKRNVHRMVNGDQTMMDLATFELIFFPILSNNCYY